MRDYIIMTDSCCSLNRQEVDELGITVLPLSFTMEGKTYLDTPDHADMSPETFFQKIADGVDCTTAAVNVGQFTDAMTSALTAGKDILCISFSSALSTTYQSACIAAEDLRGAPGGEDHRDRLSLRLPRAGHAHLPHSARAAREKSRH